MNMTRADLIQTYSLTESQVDKMIADKMVTIEPEMTYGEKWAKRMVKCQNADWSSLLGPTANGKDYRFAGATLKIPTEMLRNVDWVRGFLAAHVDDIRAHTIWDCIKQVEDRCGPINAAIVKSAISL